MFVYINGKFFPKEEAKVSVFDHGLLYGDGVFEGIRIYPVPGEEKVRIYRLHDHIQRLYRSASAIDIPLQKWLSPYDFEQAVVQTVRMNRQWVLYPPDKPDFSRKVYNYIRPVVTRGKGDLGINPDKCHDRPTVIIIVDHIDLYGDEAYEKGIPVVVCKTRRMPPECLDGRIKSLNYLNNIRGVLEANKGGVREGIMLTVSGMVAEATADNIFIIKDGKLKTPPVELGILEGVTRRSVMELAVEIGVPVEEVSFPLQDVYASQEVFLTGTGAQIVPVIRVDQYPIGNGTPGPITRMLIQRFPQVVDREPAWVV